MPARRCPHCGLVNPGSAQLCDCGYSFVYDEAPRTSHGGKSKVDAGVASFLSTRLGMRLLFALVFLGGVVAIRSCS